jgi:hypothetical protein
VQEHFLNPSKQIMAATRQISDFASGVIIAQQRADDAPVLLAVSYTS